MNLPVLRAPSRSPTPVSPSHTALNLPKVFSHSLAPKSQLLSLEDSTALRLELSKKVTFVKQPQETLLYGLTERLSEEVKAVPEGSKKYIDRLHGLNKMFQCVGLGLKERDVLVATGQYSLADYVFVTSIVKLT